MIVNQHQHTHTEEIAAKIIAAGYIFEQLVRFQEVRNRDLLGAHAGKTQADAATEIRPTG